MPDESARAVSFLAFAPPVLFYATRMWPEVPAAFFFVEAVRGVRAQRAKRWLPALLGLEMLKLRFVLVAIGLLAAGLRVRRSRLLMMLGVLAVLLLAVWMLTGSATNVHRLSELMPMQPMSYVRGFLGLLVDGMSGIAFQAPFYLFGLAALLRWKETPRGFRLGIMASLLYILFLLPRQESFGSYGPPLRYLVFLMPVLALGAAAIWERIYARCDCHRRGVDDRTGHPRRAFSWRLFHEANGENAAGEWFSQLYHATFRACSPASPPERRGLDRGGSRAVVSRLASRRRMESPALAIAVFALLLSAGFHFGRQPGTRVDFEDAHVHTTAAISSPGAVQPNRSAYRGGGVLEEGQSLTFLARAGTHHLQAHHRPRRDHRTRRSRLPHRPEHRPRTIIVTIPESGLVTRAPQRRGELDGWIHARAAPHPSPLPSAMRPPWGEGTEKPSRKISPSPRNGGERVRVRGGSRDTRGSA